MSSFQVTGMLVDIHLRRIYPATISVTDGKISSIKEVEQSQLEEIIYIMPGFIDAHVHIESSMLVPGEFARLAVVHGTVATVSDPHEIVNVCGVEGVQFMIDNGRKVPFKFYFGAPSCVPATSFETAGATLDAAEVERLLEMDEIKYLSEMMNFPGVIHDDPEVMTKIDAARRKNKPVDGHAPGLSGKDLDKYISAGISTDHECFTYEEGLEKLKKGMKVIIREGSAARNFDALVDLIPDHSAKMMFCSDDKHPDSLVEGHINDLCARAIARGHDLFQVLDMACKNPVEHYNLEVGLLRENDAADFIVVEDLSSFRVVSTYINGKQVAKNGETLIKAAKAGSVNRFSCSEKTPEDFICKSTTPDYPCPVIETLDGQLVTNKLSLSPRKQNTEWVSDTTSDILKLAVVNRYRDAPVAIAFIKNFGLKEGALASSVAHDSHNIVAVGVDDESICKAVNAIIKHGGGVSLVRENAEITVPLPVAGLMSNEDGYHVARQYAMIDAEAKKAGSSLRSPYMTLSFMALLVIPHVKLSDLGLFDGDQFRLIPF